MSTVNILLFSYCVARYVLFSEQIDSSNISVTDDFGKEDIKHILSILENTPTGSEYVSGTNITVYDICYPVLSYNKVFESIPDLNLTFCNRTWNGIDCWPITQGGTVAMQRCPWHLPHVDVTKNATRVCNSNGTWSSYTNYARCVTEGSSLPRILSQIYIIGFSISTAALVLAVIVFLSFRTLRCLRNVIHCHLIVSFICKNIALVVFSRVIKSHQKEHDKVNLSCRIVVTAVQYFTQTNFFWMFVEGLYLHTIIVWAYSAEKIKPFHYYLIGWGIPVIFIVAWITAKVKYENTGCWLPQGHSTYDWIVIIPILVVLLVNLLFLGSIIWVLITKLRASHSYESNQYRKIVKAVMVLVPLLGVTYIIFIAPIGSSEAAQTFYDYTNAIIQSFQGFLVALLFCFLNSEVQTSIKNKYRSWQNARGIATRYTRNTSLPINNMSETIPNTTRNGSATKLVQTDNNAHNKEEMDVIEEMEENV